jgi:pyruvate formate-lyase activating enzyme-like uncharacterized protein
MLPRGCELCLQGKKLVLFISGICGRRCFYCPLSAIRKNKDMIYANERPVASDEDVLEEAHLTDAEGTGFTGGDPVMYLERTVHYAKLLKNHFGDHHIHLYTTGELLNESIFKLLEKHIDELRLHTFNTRIIRSALGHSFDVGVEVPVFPERGLQLRAFIMKLDILGVRFINLNELEYSDTNIDALKKRGYVAEEHSNAIKGSEEVGRKMETLPVSMIINYCSSQRKDGVQLRNRLTRRASHIRKPYEEMEDCLLVRGVFECDSEKEAHELREKILALVDVAEDFVEVAGRKVFTHPFLAEELCDRLLIKAGIEKYYPTYNKPRIEYLPLFPQ